MAIAALNALSLMLTEEKASLETQRMIIDNRRQTIALQTADMSTEYMLMAQKNLLQDDSDEGNVDIDGVDTFNWDAFKTEYETAQAKLDAQDKFLEMERTNIDTKIEAITTTLESADKRLQKNIEADMKGIGK